MMTLTCFILCIFPSCMENTNGYSISDIGLFNSNFHLSINEIKSLGFKEVVGADIPMYHSDREDTTIVITYDFDRQTMLQTKWVIPVEFKSIDQLQSFFRKKEAYLRSNTTIIDIIKEEPFYLYQSNFNQLYECKYDTLNEAVSIVYHYPIPNSY